MGHAKPGDTADAILCVAARAELPRRDGRLEKGFKAGTRRSSKQAGSAA